jgi:hypothetical protein
MKIKFSYFSFAPQIAVVVASARLGIVANQPQTTYLDYWIILAAVAINAVAASYCSFCMEKELTIPRIHYYERAAFLWETVAEELRKEGKFAEPETLVQTLAEATERRDKDQPCR